MLQRAWANTGSSWMSCSVSSGILDGPLGPSLSWLDLCPDPDASPLSESSWLHFSCLTPWTSPVLADALPSLARSVWCAMGQLWPGDTLDVLSWFSCPCCCCGCCWFWLLPIASASCIRAWLIDWSLDDLCLCPQRWGIQHLQNWYRKKDSTSAITKITKTPVEPPKFNATMASLSVSEADVRIVSSAWGAVCVFPISYMKAVYRLIRGLSYTLLYICDGNMTVWPYDRWMYGYGYMDMDMDMDMDVDMDMDMDIDVYHRPNLERARNVGCRLFW